MSSNRNLAIAFLLTFVFAVLPVFSSYFFWYRLTSNIAFLDTSTIEGLNYFRLVFPILFFFAMYEFARRFDVASRYEMLAVVFFAAAAVGSIAEVLLEEYSATLALSSAALYDIRATVFLLITGGFSGFFAGFAAVGLAHIQKTRARATLEPTGQLSS